jgi:hypothetical protein
MKVLLHKITKNMVDTILTFDEFGLYLPRITFNDLLSTSFLQ